MSQNPRSWMVLYIYCWMVVPRVICKSHSSLDSTPPTSPNLHIAKRLCIVLLHRSKQDGVTHPMRQVVHSSKLMCHGMHIAKTSRIEGHAGQEFRIPQYSRAPQAWKKREKFGKLTVEASKKLDLRKEEWQKINLKPTSLVQKWSDVSHRKCTYAWLK